MESDHQLKEKPEFDLIIETKLVGKMDGSDHRQAAAAAGFGIGCVKHPYHHHHQRQGVCPSCLREKLSQLHDTYNFVASSKLMVAPSSTASSCTSLRSNSSAFGHVSPSRSRRHHRNVSDVLGSMSFRLSGGLRKSRSIAFASRNLGGGDQVKNGEKRGFWSKLRHHLKGKREVFVHSIQVNEQSALN